MRGWVEADEYVARLSRVATDLKQRGRAIYAQVPTGEPLSAAAAPASIQTPPSAVQPPAVSASPSDMAARAPLAANTQTSPTGSQTPGGRTGLTDDRYADFFRRTQAAPVTPIAQPSSISQGPVNMQPPMNFAPPAQASVPPVSTPSPTVGMAQAYPPSQPAMAQGPTVEQLPASAAVASAYGSQLPPPVARQAVVPLPSNQALPSSLGSPTSQAAAIPPALALDGYCPVSLAEKQQWVAGDRQWGAIHRGRTYLFAGADEQRRFLTDPDRYAPSISGNDIVLATEQGQTVPGQREHGVFFGNRVYLFSSEGTLEKFSRNPAQYANQAMGSVRTGANGGQALQSRWVADLRTVVSRTLSGPACRLAAVIFGLRRFSQVVQGRHDLRKPQTMLPEQPTQIKDRHVTLS